ncbi:nuclear transport factor 2 family protein [Paraburkholderia bryophila]|uniref:SnoaL-like domain-containing protein n=1 Tax=Paraburkholderia bryophila TaxID=420952 RepID=A0A7Y9W786_9BURK|nr:nuclear transport factor 2 family protein [Paraburkholderia bryophila]NYH15242.1 hypothetical protein [Paraburkholderia bryophila]
MTQAEQYLSPTEEQLSNARIAVQRFAAEWQNPVADNLRSLMHEDTRNLIPPMTEPADREGVVEHFRQVLTQLPDLKVDVLQWAPTGDAVMIEWQASATVAGPAAELAGRRPFQPARRPDVQGAGVLGHATCRRAGGRSGQARSAERLGRLRRHRVE